MNTRYFILLFYLINISVLSSQNLPVIYQQYNGLVGSQHNYETQLDTFKTHHITSDFGRRDYSGSEWHKGVDNLNKVFI